jgi:plastocyanin
VIDVTKLPLVPTASRRMIRAACTCALVWLLLACAQSVSGEPVVEVRIIDYRFEPAEITVAAGTTVHWTNAERRTSHSILFLGATRLESERIFPGEHWERTFDVPGTYEYGCGPHPEMRGRVTVSEAGAAPKQ